MSAGRCIAFNQLYHVCSWEEGWEEARDPRGSGRERSSTSSPLQRVEDPGPPGEHGLASSPSPCPPSGCSLQWGEWGEEPPGTRQADTCECPPLQGCWGCSQLTRCRWIMLPHPLASPLTSAGDIAGSTFQVPLYTCVPGFRTRLRLRRMLLQCPGAGLDGPGLSETSRLTPHRCRPGELLDFICGQPSAPGPRRKSK